MKRSVTRVIICLNDLIDKSPKVEHHKLVISTRDSLNRNQGGTIWRVKLLGPCPQDAGEPSLAIWWLYKISIESLQPIWISIKFFSSHSYLGASCFLPPPLSTGFICNFYMSWKRELQLSRVFHLWCQANRNDMYILEPENIPKPTKLNSHGKWTSCWTPTSATRQKMETKFSPGRQSRDLFSSSRLRNQKYTSKH